MQWSDLNSEQQRLLAAWFILADASLPEPGEELPLEAASAIYDLAISAGKRQHFEIGVPQAKPPRAIPEPLPNGRRKVVRRWARHQLAS